MINFTPTEIILFIAWFVQFIAFWIIGRRYKYCLKMLKASMEVLEENDLFGEAVQRVFDDN